MRRELALFGAAVCEGQRKTGTELAPNWLRLKGMNEILTNKFYHLEDFGDFYPELESSLIIENEKNADFQTRLDALFKFVDSMSGVLLDQLKQGRMGLVVGGDHSCALGSLAAVTRFNPEIKVVWVDAHADINTPETSPTGNPHGMPVAFFLDLIKDQKMRDLLSPYTMLRPENIVYIGLRDVDQGEREYIDKLGIKSFYASDVKDMGIEKVIDQTLSYLDPSDNSDFYLSFDVDALDPKYIPSTGTPVEEGLDLVEAREIIQRLFFTGRLCCMDLVEVNPALGEKEDLEQTVASFFALLESIPSWWEKQGRVDISRFQDNFLDEI